MNSHRLSLVLLLSTAPVLAQSSVSPVTYSYDNLDTENALAIPGAVETGFLHGFDVGPTAVIDTLGVSVGTALAPAGGLDGRLVRLCVWNDPTDDFNPSDLVLLYESAPFPATLTNSDTKVLHALPSEMSITGVTFVGALIETQPGDFPVGLDIDGFDPFETAYIVGDDTALDPNALGSASSPLNQSTNAVFLLDAYSIGGQPSIGTPYCQANQNSTGQIGEMAAFGSGSVAANDLTLAGTQLPTSQFAIFIASLDTAFVPNTGGLSNGNLCLGGTIGRFVEPGQVVQSDGSGEIALNVSLTAIPQGSGFVAVTAGESWNFQAWYRDSVGAGSNFTNGLTVTFTP